MKSDMMLQATGNGLVQDNKNPIKNKMKKYLSYILFCLFGCMMAFVSCTKEADGNGTNTPFSKAVEMVVHAVADESKDVVQSRGLIKYSEFDLNYDPTYIYLHIVGSAETVQIPLFTKTCSGQVCKCFKYHLEKFEDGSAKVTPYLADGQLASESLAVPAGAKLYFSSVEEAVWELLDSQVETKADYIYYERNTATNKEIYRSEENFTIDQLANDIESLIVGRACAGFNVSTLFYDGDELDNAVDSEEDIELEPEEFEQYMGSPLSTWYIKLYIGGPSFTDKYDLGTMRSVGVNESGYYSTGDYTPFFSKKSMIYDEYTIRCYGFYTPNGQQLLVPTTAQEVNLYVFIKHWDGEGKPDAEWLASDKEALYTKIRLDAESYPRNNNFYSYGLLMNIVQLKKAWDSKGVETTSRSADGLYYFSSEDAIVISERN